jgi:hypothetical protein
MWQSEEGLRHAADYHYCSLCLVVTTLLVSLGTLARADNNDWMGKRSDSSTTKAMIGTGAGTIGIDRRVTATAATIDAATSAAAAAQDLEVARIPSAVVQRGVRDGRDSRGDSVWRRSADAWQSKRSHGWPSVTVAVDEMHADAVSGILRMQAGCNLRTIFGFGQAAIFGSLLANSAIDRSERGPHCCISP